MTIRAHTLEAQPNLPLEVLRKLTWHNRARAKQALTYDVIPGRCASKSAVADLDSHIRRTRVNPRSDIEPGISRFPDAQLRI